VPDATPQAPDTYGELPAAANSSEFRRKPKLRICAGQQGETLRFSNMRGLSTTPPAD
jgi:hypothetical protein